MMQDRLRQGVDVALAAAQVLAAPLVRQAGVGDVGATSDNVAHAAAVVWALV